MAAALGGDAAAARCAAEKADLKQIGFVDVFDRDRFFTDGGGKGLQADGASVIKADDRLQHTAVVVVKSQLVDLKAVERGPCGVEGNHAVAHHLSKIAHALEHAVGDTRCAA